MQDYIWTVDLKEKYHSMKYIIRVSPELSTTVNHLSNVEDPIY